jgi:hypothetical protein
VCCHITPHSISSLKPDLGIGAGTGHVPVGAEPAIGPPRCGFSGADYHVKLASVGPTGSSSAIHHQHWYPAMNPEKVVFGFFIVLALTLNFGFFVGELDNPEHHNVWELFAVVVVNLIATVLKFGDRTQMGAVLLASSLVAMLQLVAAVLVWAIAVHVSGTGLTPSVTASIVSLTGGAMIANVVSVVLLVIETVMLRR